MKALPKNATLVSKDNGRVVLAYGEVTGHAHAIKSDAVALYDAIDEKTNEKLRLLKIDEKCELVHEEHTKHTLAPGIGEVIQQSEYAMQQVRNVAD